MKKNEFDSAVDILLSRQKDATIELVRRFKNTRPFRQEPVSRKEMILDYDDLMSREPQLRQEFGDELVEKYKAAISAKLGGR